MDRLAHHKQDIIDAINANHPFHYSAQTTSNTTQPRHSENKFSKIYPADESNGAQYVAKVFFGDPYSARRECETLLQLSEFKPTLRVPEVYGLLDLGTITIPDIPGGAIHAPTFAILLERIHGRDLTRIPLEERSTYRKPVQHLLETMQMQGLYRPDLTAEDIVGLTGKKKVYLVNAKNMTFGNVPKKEWRSITDRLLAYVGTTHN